LDAEETAETISSMQRQLHVERRLAELAGGLKTLKQEQQAQDRCLHNLQESFESCRNASLQCYKRVEEHKMLLEEFRADGQDCAARVEEHEVRLGVARSKMDTQDQLLTSLGNRLELQGEQIMSQMQRHCNQATQKLRSELMALYEDALGQIREHMDSSEDRSRQEAKGAAARGKQPEDATDVLAVVLQSMATAQRSISEVKETLLMLVEGHTGAKSEVQELRPTIEQIADRIAEQEFALSSLKKNMDQVSASLKERIEKAETSSECVTGLFQELRKDMARILAEEPGVSEDRRPEVISQGVSVRRESPEGQSQTTEQEAASTNFKIELPDQGTANSSRPLLDSSSIPFASPGLPSEPSDQDAWNVNPVEADTQNRSGVQSAGQSGEQNGQQNVQEGEEAKPFFSSKLPGWSVGAAGGTWPTYAEDNQLEVLEAPAAPTTAPEGPEAGEGAISEHPKHAESTEHPEHPRCGSSEDEAQSQSNPCSSDLDAVSEEQAQQRSQLATGKGCGDGEPVVHSNLEPLSKLAMDLDSEPEETADLMQEEDEVQNAGSESKATSIAEATGQSSSSAGNQNVHNVQSAAGSRRSFQPLTLVDSDGEYDDDEFEDDDLTIEIQESRRSSLKSQE